MRSYECAIWMKAGAARQSPRSTLMLLRVTVFVLGLTGALNWNVQAQSTDRSGCEQPVPPAGFVTRTLPVHSDDRSALTQNIALNVAPIRPAVVESPVRSNETNYSICNGPVADQNGRHNPSRVETIPTAEALQIALSKTCPQCATDRLFVLPAGVFNIGQTLELCAGCVLRGAGITNTIIRSNHPMRIIRMANDSRIENLTVEGTWDGQDDSYDHPDRHGFGIVANGIRNFALINVRVANNSAQGVSVGASGAGCLWGIELSKNGHRGINISEFSRDIRLNHIRGMDAHLGHVLVGHGSHHIRMDNSYFENMTISAAERRIGRANNNAFVWINQQVRDVELRNVTIAQTKFDPLINPKGLLVANSQMNRLRHLTIRDVPIGIQIVAGRVDLAYADLANDDVRGNSFEDVLIDAQRLPRTIAAVRFASTRLFNVPGACPLRRLTSGQEELLPRIRDNVFAHMKVAGYSTTFLEAPTDFAAGSVPPKAFLVDGVPPRAVSRAPVREDVTGSAGW